MRYAVFYTFAPIVLAQLAFCFSVTLSLGILIAKRKLQKRKLERRLLVYLYEVPLIALYSHFLWNGPSVPAPTAGSLVYWSAQLCFIEFVVAPVIIDRRFFIEELRFFRPRTQKKIGPFRRLMWMGVRSLLVLLFFVYFFGRLARCFALMQQ